MNTPAPRYATISASVSYDQKQKIEQFAASRGLSESEVVKRAVALYTAEETIEIGRREGIDELEVLRRALAEYSGDKEVKLNTLFAQRVIKAELLADRILFYLTARDEKPHVYAATLSAVSKKVEELIPSPEANQTSTEASKEE